MRLIFDIESNGLLDTITVIHSLCIKNPDTGEKWSCHDQPGSPHHSIEFGLKLLETADVLIGHNILGFDILAIQKLHPWWKPKGKFFDTMNASRLIWTDLKDRDFRELRRNQDIKYFMGLHKLEAWGVRLGLRKATVTGKPKDEEDESVWEKWTPEMQVYCEQDVLVTERLFTLIESKGYSPEALQLEFDFQWIISLQEDVGFAFDQKAATHLYGLLSERREKLVAYLQGIFLPKQEVMKTPQYYEWKPVFGGEPLREETKGRLVDAVKAAGHKVKEGTIEPGPMKIKLHPFNPNSRQQVADRLTEKYGWKPTVFTDDGQPKIDEDILSCMAYPEAKPLLDFFLVAKRIGQVAEGKQAWLKNVAPDGRLYGSMITNGAVSGRCTHKLIANVPKPPAEYGKECRECFTVTPGWVLVGCDAQGLEARNLANRMAPYDGGAYIETVVNGDKAKGTDIHTVNQKAAGLKDRDTAKTWFYGFIYGAGDELLGFNAGVNQDDVVRYKRDCPKQWARIVAKRTKQKKCLDDINIAACLKGAELRARFLASTPALAKVIEVAKAEAEEKGYLIGLDGRKLHSRSSHSALNLMLQSDGAIIMKKASCIFFYELAPKHGWVWGRDYRFVIHYHDEFQAEVRPELAEEVGKELAHAITLAGEHFKFQCKQEGEFKIGHNWYETH